MKTQTSQRCYNVVAFNKKDSGGKYATWEEIPIVLSLISPAYTGVHFSNKGLNLMICHKTEGSYKSTVNSALHFRK